MVFPFVRHIISYLIYFSCIAASYCVAVDAPPDVASSERVKETEISFYSKIIVSDVPTEASSLLSAPMVWAMSRTRIAKAEQELMQLAKDAREYVLLLRICVESSTYHAKLLWCDTNSIWHVRNMSSLDRTSKTVRVSPPENLGALLATLQEKKWFVDGSHYMVLGSQAAYVSWYNGGQHYRFAVHDPAITSVSTKVSQKGKYEALSQMVGIFVRIGEDSDSQKK